MSDTEVEAKAVSGCTCSCCKRSDEREVNVVKSAGEIF